MPVVPSAPRHCPSCGAPDASRHPEANCAYCRGPLVPLGHPDPRNSLRCSACARSAPEGSSFCPGCGTALAQRSPASVSKLPCPGCTDGPSRLEQWDLLPTPEQPQGHPVLGCRRCGGVWLGRTTLDSMLQALARDTVAAPSEFRRTLPSGLATAKIIHRNCPVCEYRMLRKNFGRVSGVVVDECGHHGTFFDPGELEDVLTFVRSGGLRSTERFERDERARERRASTFAQRPLSTNLTPGLGPGSSPSPELGDAVFRWAERWLRSVLS